MCCKVEVDKFVLVELASRKIVLNREQFFEKSKVVGRWVVLKIGSFQGSKFSHGKVMVDSHGR
jgi:hypothetical protein